MDVDYLKMLIAAVLDEEDSTGNSDASYAALVAYVDEARFPEMKREIERLRVNWMDSCTCPHGDASAPLHNHDRICPIRVNKAKRIAPEVAIDRLAAALEVEPMSDEDRDFVLRVLETCDPASDCAIGNAEIERARKIVERA